MPDEILTLEEVAKLPDPVEKMVHAIAQPDERLVFEARGPRHIKRGDLDQWIDAQPGAGGGRHGVA